MEIKIKIPEFNLEQGITYHWEDDFKIEVKSQKGVVTISANKQGLLSLANHFINLTQEKIPINYHLHFDEYNSLEDGSHELIVEKI